MLQHVRQAGTGPQFAPGTTRRECLRLGALLWLGRWPGCARSAGAGWREEYAFAVLNDTHFQTSGCPAWFERVRDRLRAHAPRPEFCLVVGDLSNVGSASELGGMRDALRSFGMPFHTVVGNHDYASSTDRGPYEALFPHRLNYHFEHRGWRFIGLDSCEGNRSWNTRVQRPALDWLDATLPTLDPARPTVLFTHFPLGAGVEYRPRNADGVLERFLGFNLVGVFNGHYHGLTERRSGGAVVTTNTCCTVSRPNFDGTTAKGYFLCRARDGRIERQFVEVQPA